MNRCNRCMRPLVATLCRNEECELSPFYTAQAFDDRDAVDKMAATDAEDWERMLDPIVGEVMRAAQSSKTEREFLAKLTKLDRVQDPEEFVQQLALSTFKVRGMGDATDTVT